MPNEATIVAASLSDQELKNSIDALVKHVEEGTNKMALSMDDAVERMKKKLAELGNTNITIGGDVNDGGATKRAKGSEKATQAVKEETQATQTLIDKKEQVKKSNQETVATYDQLAQAMQKASGGATSKAPIGLDANTKVLQEQVGTLEQLKQKYTELQAIASRRFDESPIQTLRMQQHQLEAGMRVASAEAAKAKKDVDDLNASIEGYRRTMSSLPNDKNGFAQRQALQKEINDMTVLRDVAMAEQKKWMDAGAQLSLEYERTKTQIREMGQELINVDNAQRNANGEAQKYTEEILRQAKAIRETKEWQEKGRVVIGDVVYQDPERTNLSKRGKEQLLTLEQQIAQQIEQQALAQQKTTQEAQASAQAKKEEVSEEVRALQSAGSRVEVLQRSRDILREMQVASNTTNASFVAQLESSNRLNEKLKELRAQYANMSLGQRNSEEGRQIAQNIRTISREAQKLQSTLARPMNLQEALGHPEKTLDDIAYKMKQLRAYRQGISLVSPNAASELRTVDDAIKRLDRDMGRFMNTTKQTNATLKALTRSVNYMKNRLAFYFTVGASTQFVKTLIDIRAQYEMNERALGILVDSAERGTQIFKELSDMALVSPYTLIELSDAAKQLTAYDIAAKDVVDTTRRLADMAAAVGIPIERLTYALGQIKAYGYLNSRDNRMFANAGIPLVKQLADYYTELEGRLVSTADVYDRIKKKAVDYNDVMSVINKMTDEGGKFFDFQAKMAETLKVQLANLTLAWNNMLNEIGESQQGLLTGAIGTLKELFLQWENINKILNDVIITFGVYKAITMSLHLLFGKRTLAIIKDTAAMEGSTAATYRNALAGQTLSKEQAKMTLLWYKNNAAIREAIASMGLLTTSEYNNIIATKGLQRVWMVGWVGVMNVFKALGSILKSLGALFVKALPLLAIMGVIDLLQHWSNEAEKTAEMNRELAESAREASQSIAEFLKNEEIMSNRQANDKGTISSAQLKKTWDALREEIEKSSDASDDIITRLMGIDDLSQRVKKGFEWAESIKKAEDKLSDLEDELEVSQDSWVWGAFGEGLGEDMQDYVEHLKKVKEEAKEAGLEGKEAAEYFAKWADKGQTFAEMRSEVKKIADNMVKILEDKEITDPKEIEEALARMRKVVKDKSPELKGDVEKMFDVNLDLVLASRIKGFDKTTSVVNQLMEHVKRSSSHLFQDITEDTKTLSQDQKDAIMKGIDKLRQELPPSFGRILDSMQHDLNSRDWVLRVRTVFGTEGKNWLQQDIENRLPNVNINVGTTTDLSKLIGEQQNALKAAKEEMKALKDAGWNSATLVNADKKTQQHFWDTQKSIDDTTKFLKAYNAELEKSSKSKKGGGSKKDEILESLKQEIDLVKKVQSEYDKLTKSGASVGDASATISKAFGKTLNYLNTKLRGYGLEEVDLSKIVGLDPNKQLEFFKRLRDNLSSKGLGNLERLKAVEAVINELTVTAKTYNLDKITKGLNSELDKLKDEYELSLELDANPVLGSIFEQLFDIDPSQLPRTIREYSDKVTDALNNKLNEAEQDFNVTDLLGMSRERMNEIVNALPKDSVWKGIIEKLWKEIHDANKKAVTDAAKEWDKLVEKYGTLQDKLVHISKEGAQARFSVIKQFGSEEEIAASKTLLDNIMKEQDPQKIASMIEEMMVRVNAIIARNPNAKVVIDATINQTSKNMSKAYWDDFKDGDLYSMTFEDMAKNSTRAINLIVDRLDELKDKVKEDPASMKALMGSLNTAQNELVKRNPLKALVQSFEELKNARQGVKTATEALGTADGEVAYWEEQVKKLRNSGEDEKYIDAQDKLAKAKEKQAKAQVNLAQAENTERTAKEKMVDSLEATQQAMEATQGAFNALSNAFRAFGDEDTADMLGEIANGFAMIIPVVVAVAVAIKTLESTSVILLAISAALATIIGMVSWLSGSDDKKIVKQIEESKNAVHRLEMAYKSLTYAVEDSFGTIVMGFRQAQKANKEYQLVELKRQLRLEKSRDSKYRDEDRIRELKSQIIELEHEIAKATEETLNDIMGISSLGEFFQNLVDDMIEAFKNGEDGMEKFAESWDEMVDSMVGKLLLQKVFTPFINAMSEDMQNIIEKYTKDSSKERADLTSRINDIKTNSDYSLFLRLREDADNVNKILGEFGIHEDILSMSIFSYHNVKGSFGSDIWEKIRDRYLEYLEGSVNALDEAIAYQTADATEELIEYAKQKKEEAKGIFSTELLDMLRDYYTFGQDKDKELSALQQGIGSLTEETGGAIESYLNIISQRIFEHGNILVQIRDAVIALDMDVQTSMQAQMLLQLQTNYQLMQTMASMMNGWSTPSGNGIRVELLN